MGPLSHGKYLSWWILTLCIDSLWQHTPTDTKLFKISKLVQQFLVWTFCLLFYCLLKIFLNWNSELTEWIVSPGSEPKLDCNMSNQAKSWSHLTWHLHHSANIEQWDQTPNRQGLGIISLRNPSLLLQTLVLSEDAFVDLYENKLQSAFYLFYSFFYPWQP